MLQSHFTMDPSKPYKRSSTFINLKTKPEFFKHEMNFCFYKGHPFSAPLPIDTQSSALVVQTDENMSYILEGIQHVGRAFIVYSNSSREEWEKFKGGLNTLQDGECTIGPASPGKRYSHIIFVRPTLATNMLLPSQQAHYREKILHQQSLKSGKTKDINVNLRGIFVDLKHLDLTVAEAKYVTTFYKCLKSACDLNLESIQLELIEDSAIFHEHFYSEVWQDIRVKALIKALTQISKDYPQCSLKNIFMQKTESLPLLDILKESFNLR